MTNNKVRNNLLDFDSFEKKFSSMTYKEAVVLSEPNTLLIKVNYLKLANEPIDVNYLSRIITKYPNLKLTHVMNTISYIPVDSFISAETNIYGFLTDNFPEYFKGIN